MRSKRNVKLLGSKYKFDFVITEIGGTVGDIESLPFIESVRPVEMGAGQELPLRTSYLRALYRRGEEYKHEAYATFREAIAGIRHPAGRAGVAYGA